MKNYTTPRLSRDAEFHYCNEGLPNEANVPLWPWLLVVVVVAGAALAAVVW